MIRTYSQMHRTDKYSQHSSIIWPVWPNGWVFVYELSGCGFESNCSHWIINVWKQHGEDQNESTMVTYNQFHWCSFSSVQKVYHIIYLFDVVFHYFVWICLWNKPHKIFLVKNLEKRKNMKLSVTKSTKMFFNCQLLVLQLSYMLSVNIYSFSH